MIRRGVSKKNAYSMAENMEYLRRHLEHFKYDNDYKISLLFQQNKSRILMLLPGLGSGIYDKRMREYSNYDELTREIITRCKRPIRPPAGRNTLTESNTHGGLSP